MDDGGLHGKVKRIPRFQGILSVYVFYIGYFFAILYRRPWSVTA